MDNCPRCGYDLARESVLGDWIDVEDYLPSDKQKVSIKGIPVGCTGELIIDIIYNERVGFIKNITHWKPNES